jgi:hypothetical protein
MKLNLHCYECRSSEPIQVDITDQGYYEATCPKGHQLQYILQQQLFEILFQIALYAIIDGYYREAVTSFASSLERFYEFYVKFISNKNGLTKKDIDDGWKPLSKASERQLGAFVFTYLNECKVAPRLINNKWTEFRNSVIHKGTIPKREEVVQYGQAVLNVLEPVLNELKLKYPNEIRASVLAHQLSVSKKNGNTEGGICWFTFVSLSTVGPSKSLTIEQGLEAITKKMAAERKSANQK